MIKIGQSEWRILNSDATVINRQNITNTARYSAFCEERLQLLQLEG